VVRYGLGSALKIEGEATEVNSTCRVTFRVAQNCDCDAMHSIGYEWQMHTNVIGGKSTSAMRRRAAGKPGQHS